MSAKIETKPPDRYHHRNLRQALVACAVGLLEQEGESAITLRRVAAQIGVSHNAPYRHFDSKDALMRAVAAAGHRALEQALGAAAQHGRKQAVPDLISITEAYVRFTFDHSALTQVMFERQNESDADLAAAQRSSFGMLERAVADAMPRGDDDTQEIAFLLWASAFGAIHLAPLEQSVARAERERWVLGRLAKLLSIVFPALQRDARGLVSQ